MKEKIIEILFSRPIDDRQDAEDTANEILALLDVVGQSVQLKCDCCNGTGVVEGEHFDDLQSCNTCLGRGTF